MTTKGKKYTIHDLARDLGLSSGTVSKIINGKGTVGDGTRTRVLEYARKVGFVQSHSARVLKATHSWTIGVVFADIASFGLEHPFFGPVLQAFKNTIEAQGYELVFIPKRLGQKELTCLQWARNKRVDGVLILSGDINNPEIKELVLSEIPCVSTDIVMKGLTTVISDDALGITLAFKHFIKMGYQNIYAYSGPTESRAYAERLLTFRTLLKETGIQEKPDTFKISSKYGFNFAYENAVPWVQQWKEKPDAIIAFSDDLAMGLITALKENGYRVPEEIAVSGYDDISFAKLFNPSLTTIRQNKSAIAIKAAETLLALIADEKPKANPSVVHKIPVELVIRQSTKIKQS